MYRLNVIACTALFVFSFMFLGQIVLGQDTDAHFKAQFPLADGILKIKVAKWEYHGTTKPVPLTHSATLTYEQGESIAGEFPADGKLEISLVQERQPEYEGGTSLLLLMRGGKAFAIAHATERNVEAARAAAKKISVTKPADSIGKRSSSMPGNGSTKATDDKPDPSPPSDPVQTARARLDNDLIVLLRPLIVVAAPGEPTNNGFQFAFHFETENGPIKASNPIAKQRLDRASTIRSLKLTIEAIDKKTGRGRGENVARVVDTRDSNIDAERLKNSMSLASHATFIFTLNPEIHFWQAHRIRETVGILDGYDGNRAEGEYNLTIQGELVFLADRQLDGPDKKQRNLIPAKAPSSIPFKVGPVRYKELSPYSAQKKINSTIARGAVDPVADKAGYFIHGGLWPIGMDDGSTVYRFWAYPVSMKKIAADPKAKMPPSQLCYQVIVPRNQKDVTVQSLRVREKPPATDPWYDGMWDHLPSR